MRATPIVVWLLFLMIPSVATGQAPGTVAVSSATGSEAPGRLSVQVAAGPTVIGGGNSLSAAFGYRPTSRLELLLNVERDHLPFRSEQFDGVYSATRGGTMTFVSGEVRAAFRQPDRVSPFAIAGLGGGISRPNVNDQFPNRVRNDLRVIYFGGGIRVPLRRHISLFGDARIMMAVEGDDGVLAVWPVRVGVSWRF